MHSANGRTVSINRTAWLQEVAMQLGGLNVRL
jgi:hypothetical protein